jgi:hypothetical protein
MFAKIITTIITSGFLFSLNTSYALHSTLDDSEQLKKDILYHDQLSRPKVAKSIVLPVSRGFDQKYTCLCWSYAFFNALESLYLIAHPGSTLELSRGAMQYINLQDRIDLTIYGVEDHLNPKEYKGCSAEGGTPLSAEFILKNYGAMPYEGYHDIISPPSYSNMYYSIFVDNTTPKQKKTIADSLLAAYFGSELPETIDFNGQQLSPLEFAKQILPNGVWTTYAISPNGREYIGAGLDPDARRNEKTHFISKENFIQKIKQSLMNKRPFVYSSYSHSILIYGADFNDNDQPISLYVKDSSERAYFYKADFELALNNIMEMTVLE